MKLYHHQQAFLDKNPDKALCAWEVGTGKSFIAVEWLRSRQGHPIVIVPKRIVKKWTEDLATAGVDAQVVTKEQFKKLPLTRYSAVVFDEAHFASSALFTRQRSQLSEKLYHLVQAYPSMPILLLTATPISSSPANLHTLLCFMGVYIPWKKWQEYFYELKKMPYLPRPAWIPKPNWRTLIRSTLIKYADIALMRDCVDLPPETEHVITLTEKPFTPTEFEAMAVLVEQHRHEQEGKVATIKEIAEGHRKVVIVAYFRQQIEDLEKALSSTRSTYTLHGGTKNPEEVIRLAQEDDECYIIVQSSVGVGFDLDTFAVMVFASQGYSYVSYVQMKGRIQRIKNIHPCIYYYLQAGKIDKAIYKQVKKGEDFDPKYFYDSTP